MYLCLTEVLGEGSFEHDVVKLKRRLTIGTPGPLWKETWMQMDPA